MQLYIINPMHTYILLVQLKLKYFTIFITQYYIYIT